MAAASTCAGRDWERKTQPAEQQDAEVRRRHGDFAKRGEDCEGPGGMRVLPATAAALEMRNQGQKNASRARWSLAVAASRAKSHPSLVRPVVPAGAAKTPRQEAQTLARGRKGAAASAEA